MIVSASKVGEVLSSCCVGCDGHVGFVGAGMGERVGCTLGSGAVSGGAGGVIGIGVGSTVGCTLGSVAVSGAGGG